MKPTMDCDRIEIPMTLDVSSGNSFLTAKKMKLGLAAIILSMFIVVFFALITHTLLSIIILSCLEIAFLSLMRLVYFKEWYYKKQIGKLKQNNYTYTSNLFWNIYAVPPNFPICSFKNGTKAVFVAFDKDTVVGKGENNAYIHYEAISDAFQLMAKKKIDCVHIDYMDTVGKDGRLDTVESRLLTTKNPELRKLLGVVFEYQGYTMSNSYASYDVYAFYYRYEDNLFRDDLEALISLFMRANYIRYRLLNVDSLRELVKPLYNLNDFSVYLACDSVFKKQNGTKHLRIIYTETDGVRTDVNKTREETKPSKSNVSAQNIEATNAQSQVKETEFENDDFIYLDSDDVVKDFAGEVPNSNSNIRYTAGVENTDDFESYSKELDLTEDQEELDLFSDEDTDTENPKTENNKSVHNTNSFDSDEDVVSLFADEDDSVDIFS